MRSSSRCHLALRLGVLPQRHQAGGSQSKQHAERYPVPRQGGLAIENAPDDERRLGTGILEDRRDRRQQDRRDQNERPDRHQHQDRRIDQRRADSAAGLDRSFEERRQLTQHLGQISARLAGPHHAAIEVAETALALHGFRQRGAFEQVGQGLFGDLAHCGAHRLHCDDAQCLVERDVGFHQGGKLAREQGEAGRRQGAAGKQVALPPACFARAAALFDRLDRQQAGGPQLIEHDAIADAVDLAGLQRACTVIGSVPVPRHQLTLVTRSTSSIVVSPPNAFSNPSR